MQAMTKLYHKECGGGEICSVWEVHGQIDGSAFLNEQGHFEPDYDSADIDWCGDETLIGYRCDKCGEWWEDYLGDPAEHPEIEIRNDPSSESGNGEYQG
jgi:hypothetical protein